MKVSKTFDIHHYYKKKVNITYTKKEQVLKKTGVLQHFNDTHIVIDDVVIARKDILDWSPVEPEVDKWLQK